MPELSNLLRQRLALAESVDGHPDADTLNAYAEKLLPVPERNRILEHIALCSECRDVISLSLEASPVDTQATVAAAAMPTRGRRAWAPLFGLGAAFAAMAIVAVLIVKQPQRAQPTAIQIEETKSIPPSATPSLAAADQLTATQPPALSASRSADARESAARARLPEARAYVAGAVMAKREAASPAPPVVVSSNTATVEAITASVAVNPRRDYLNDNLFRPGDSAVTEIPSAQSSRGAPPQFQNFAGNVQLRANADLPVPAPGSKPVWTSSPASGRGVIFLAPFKQAGKHLILPSISAAGLMAKAMGSSDGQFNPAKDLQSVEVAAAKGKEAAELDQSHAFTRRALSPSAMATLDTHPQPSWAVGDGKLLKTNESGAWVSGYSGGEIEFSYVTFHDSDVWAGGNHAALLHSRDGGATWERLRLGANAAGNITLILAGGQSIQVTTSDNQSWSSQDGGRTWTQD